MLDSKLLKYTFYLTVFLSTGGVIDFLVLGNSREIQIQNDSNLRLLLWLPLYISFAFFTFIYSKVILKYLLNYKALLAIFSLILASVVWSDVPTITAYSAAQLILISTFAIAVGNTYRLEVILETLYKTFCLIIVLSAITVILLPDYGTLEYVGITAYRGIFIEKNRLGQILVYYFALSFAFFRPKAYQFFILACAIFLLSGNDSATALVLIVLLPILIKATKLFYGHKETIARNTVGIFILTLLTVVALVFTFEILLELLGKDPTLTGRTELWQLGLSSITERPLTGFGYNAFWPSSSEWGGEYIQLLIKWGPQSMHNGWFELILQLGIMGALLCLFTFFQYFKLSLASIDKTHFSPVARVTMIILILIFIWSQMQHILFRHQEITHFMFVLLFSALNKAAFANPEQISTNER